MMFRRILRLGAICFSVVVVAWLAVVLWHFPWAVDPPVIREETLKAFYTAAYEPENKMVKDTPLARAAQKAAETFHIRDRVAQFVSDYNLLNGRILDVGSGSGYLQDVVADYTGLDISPTAARFYHKKFVAGTATAMPFRDGEFDAAWSVWVLEHIPNPEAALHEIRRVVKKGGYVYLNPAWACVPWAADGYDARPYSDFGMTGKLIKASIPIRRSWRFQRSYTLPARAVRSLVTGPTQLHYRRLTPNYREYWQADSNAVNSLDQFEVARWFESRGDVCVNCPASRIRGVYPTALVFQRK